MGGALSRFCFPPEGAARSWPRKGLPVPLEQIAGQLMA
jgi:hypothetical protein